METLGSTVYYPVLQLENHKTTVEGCWGYVIEQVPPCQDKPIVSANLNTPSRPNLFTSPLETNQAIGSKALSMGKVKIQLKTTMTISSGQGRILGTSTTLNCSLVIVELQNSIIHR